MIKKIMFMLQKQIQLEMYQGAADSIPAIPLNKAAFSGSDSSYITFQNLLGDLPFAGERQSDC